MALHVFQNDLGMTVIARNLDEAIALAKKHRQTRGLKTTGLVMKYKQLPDKQELVVFERYSQRFIPMKASVWAKRIGKGIPNAED